MRLSMLFISLFLATVVWAQNKVGVNTNAPLETLDVNGNTNLRGALKINGSGGTNGQVLVSKGNNIAPAWQSIAAVGGGRFWSFISNNSYNQGREGYSTMGNSTQSDSIDLGFTKLTGTDISVSNAGTTNNFITINTTGLYHFEGAIRMFVTNSAAISMAPRASIKLSTNEPTAGDFSVIVVEEMMQQESSTISGSNDFHNLLCRFDFNVHLAAGTTIAFIAEFTRLKTSPELIGIGVSSGGYLSGYLVSE